MGYHGSAVAAPCSMVGVRQDVADANLHRIDRPQSEELGSRAIAHSKAETLKIRYISNPKFHIIFLNLN